MKIKSTIKLVGCALLLSSTIVSSSWAFWNYKHTFENATRYPVLIKAHYAACTKEVHLLNPGTSKTISVGICILSSVEAEIAGNRSGKGDGRP